MLTLRASYFDGRSAHSQPVLLWPTPGEIHVCGDAFERREPLQAVRIGEALGRAPRLIHFADGAHLEISDHAGTRLWLRTIGYREGLIERLQRSRAAAEWAFALVLLVAVVAYRWGLPWLAALAAPRVPATFTQALTQRTLSLIDGQLLQPSHLDAQHRARLESAFGQLTGQASAQLMFRSAPLVGPNAMALPDGRVVLLDELVMLADNDQQVLAVLAHEWAHVERHHAMRLMIQGTAGGALVAWWIGDFGPLLAAAPAALLQSRYSREFEAEADARAAAQLRRAGISPARLAEMLEKLSAHSAATADNGSHDTGWLGYLASHPAPRERIAALRRMDAASVAP